MAQINTVVNGTTAECRQTANWLGRVSSGVDSNADAIAKAQTDSEGCWQGTAADGFRDHVGRMALDADKLSASALTVEQALIKFANDLDTVKARIDQARSISSAAGLIVTSDAIEGPGPAPTHRTGPMGGQEATEYYQAQQRHNTQVSAFDEAKATVNQARQLEAKAHANLTAPMRDATNTVQTLVTISSNVSGVALSTIQGVQGAAKDLYDDSDAIEAHAQRMEQLALDSDLSDAGRAAAARAAQVSGVGAAATEEQAAGIERSVSKIPQGVRTAIAANPGDLLEDSSGLLRLTKGVLAGVPYAGTLGSITFGAVSVVDGSETPKQAVAETAGGIAGGAVGAASGAELGAAIGSIFPGAGTVAGGVIGGLAGGIIGTLAGGKAGDAVVGAK